jgi:hypothetical protein
VEPTDYAHLSWDAFQHARSLALRRMRPDDGPGDPGTGTPHRGDGADPSSPPHRGLISATMGSAGGLDGPGGSL